MIEQMESSGGRGRDLKAFTGDEPQSNLDEISVMIWSEGLISENF